MLPQRRAVGDLVTPRNSGSAWEPFRVLLVERHVFEFIVLVATRITLYKSE
jgi:hypothetical protein